MPKASGFRGRNKSRFGGGNFVRKNERIRAREMRLIGPDGKQVGVVSREDALKLAKYYGLDLVEVSNNVNPPVCRILDFGKYMYEQSKKSKDTKSTASKIKEVKFRVRIEQHDYMTKLRRAEEFLYKGNKVKISLMFRGREMEHRELGIDMVNRAAHDLEHVGHSEGEARMMGRHVNMVVAPLAQNKRKLKYNEVEDLNKPEEPEKGEPEDDHEDEES